MTIDWQDAAMAEVNLMDSYPKSKRPLSRGYSLPRSSAPWRAASDASYFDGDRLTGYGGYHYHPRILAGHRQALSRY